MRSPQSAAFVRRFTPFALALAGSGLLSATVGAQEQDRKLLDRIEHPNMELHAEGFEKSFETKASNGDRKAAVRPFLFGSGAADFGTFHAKTFNDGRGTFRTASFSVKPAIAADRQAAQANRLFATNSVAVREDRLANKTMESRDYVNSTKPFLVPGKRQDTIDELRKQKNLTSDQVREILNKSK